MKKILAGFLFFVVIALGLVFYKGQQSAAPEAGLVKVRINLTRDVASSLIWVAETAGYFKEQHLSAEFKLFDAGKLSLADMLKDPEVDYAFVYGTPIIKQIIAGQEVRMLTSLHTSNRNTLLIVKGVKPAVDRDGLVGKRIAVTLGTNAEFGLYEILNRNGVQLSEVVVLNVPPTEIAQKMAGQDIDAAIIWNPYLKGVVDLLNSNKIAYWKPNTGSYQEYSFLTTDRQRLEKNEALTVKVLQALKNAYDLYRKDPEKFAQYAAMFKGIDRDPKVIAAELNNYDLAFGFTNQMVQSLQGELRYFCTTQDKCDAETLQRLDAAISTSAIETVAPQLVKARVW